MKLLIAEDDVFFRKLLEQILASDYELVLAEDGQRAWAELQKNDSPRIAILDWVMPGMTGPQVCREVRQSSRLFSMYLIILTAKNSVADVVSGLRAGADDYVTKPFEPHVLRARVKLGERIVNLQDSLNVQLTALRQSQIREAQLQQFLSICSHCRKLSVRSGYCEAGQAPQEGLQLQELSTTSTLEEILASTLRYTEAIEKRQTSRKATPPRAE
jgi:DNA-binding response OmpR family regulator